MENKSKTTQEDVQGTPSEEKKVKLSFSWEEINEMYNNTELLLTVRKLSQRETNKGKSGSYLLAVAREILE